MAWSKKALVATFALTITGCDPQFNLSGAYFPDWLVCTLGGLIGAWILHLLLLPFGLTPHLRPAVIVYPAVFVAFACALWLIFFASA